MIDIILTYRKFLPHLAMLNDPKIRDNAETLPRMETKIAGERLVYSTDGVGTG
jgi:hypothetical protein